MPILRAAIPVAQLARRSRDRASISGIRFPGSCIALEGSDAKKQESLDGWTGSRPIELAMDDTPRISARIQGAAVDIALARCTCLSPMLAGSASIHGWDVPSVNHQTETT